MKKMEEEEEWGRGRGRGTGNKEKNIWKLIGRGREMEEKKDRKEI